MGVLPPKTGLNQYYSPAESPSCGGPVQQVYDLIYQLDSASGGQGFPVFYNATGSPAANTGIGGSIYNVTYIDGNDTIAGGTLPTVIFGVYDNINSGMTGNHIAIYGFIQNAQPQVATTPGYNLVGVWGFAKAIDNMGGTDTVSNSAGRIFGMNPQVAATNLATNLATVAGMEVDVQVNSGCSTKNRFGIDITTLPNDAVQATGLDTALLISAANGASAWKKGITINEYSVPGQAPIDPAGTILEASGGYTVKYGIDFSNITITTAALITSGSIITTNFIGANTNNGFNASDRMAVFGSFNSAESLTIKNGTSGTAAQTVIFLASTTSNSQAALILNSAGFSGGNGANALTLRNSGTSPLVIGGGTEPVIVKIPTSATGLPSGALWNNGGVVNIVP
jgi:hypothetical protein